MPLTSRAWLFVSVLGLFAASPAAAADIRADFSLVAATVAPWDGFDEAGNAVGIAGGIHINDFRVTLNLAGVLPDSRTQGKFATFFAEARWHVLRALTGDRDLPVAPYLLLGLGVAAEDGAGPPAFGQPPPVRWNASGAEFLTMAGLGASYGAYHGLYVAFDVRTYNISHVGLVFGAGYAF